MPNEETIRWPLLGRPVVRSAGLFPLDAGNFSFAYRSRFHALHLHEYAGTIRIGDVEYPLSPGTLTISPADTDSSYDLPRPGIHWCIHFEALPIRKGMLAVNIPLVKSFGAVQAEALTHFSNISRMHALRERSPANVRKLELATGIALQALLVWISMIDQAGIPAHDPRGGTVVDQLLDYIDRNLSQRLRASDLCSQAGLSQNYLARLFRRHTGVTLPRYVLARRIGLARLLLETTDLPVKQIARRVGLPDAHHFNKQFRALTGMSPTAARSTPK